MSVNSAYKWFIDNLVEVAKHGASSRHLREKGQIDGVRHKELAADPGQQKLAHLLGGLSPEQRALIAGLIDETRRRAVHDVAGFLEWAAAEAKLSIVLDTQSITARPYATMHVDFLCRCEGERWPDSAADVPQ